MALERRELIEILGEEREVYTRIEEETSLKKGVYNVRCRKYLLNEGKPLEKSFDEFVLQNIEIDLELPVRKQLYKFINDGTYENILE
jgi:hypothetical protein